jgi:hypothetical protein
MFHHLRTDFAAAFNQRNDRDFVAHEMAASRLLLPLA